MSSIDGLVTVQHVDDRSRSHDENPDQVVLGHIATVRMGSRIVRISEKEIQRVIRDGIS